MELQQQVSNFHSTARFLQPFKPHFKAEDHSQLSHNKALQVLGNGELDVPYHSTLRVVVHEGSRAPKLAPRITQKHPGYTRNDLGGVFCS